MRKIFYIIIINILLLSAFALKVDASTNTYTRTESNLRVPNDVSTNNKANIYRTPSVDEDEKIYDFAKIISDYDEKLLFEKIEEFIDEYDMDMVVVTINKSEFGTAMSYADDFYDYNYFGKNKTRDGLLLLIDMYKREVAISTSGHAILVYDDNRIDRMLDYLETDLGYGTYYDAVDTFIENATKYAKKGIAPSNKNAYIDENGDIVYVSPFPWFMIIVISIIITVVTISILLSRHKQIKKSSTAKYYLKSINITNREDKFITTFTTSTIISSSSSGSHGSSTHRSSSGRSHGGGSRRF